MINAATLQIIAILSMTIDHIAYYLLPDLTIFRIIGRLAFPLFAFMLVEGFKHTHSRSRYFLRLLLTALVTQVLFYVVSSRFGYNYSHNVMFTLAFSLISLICAEQGGFYIIAIPLLALAAGAFECEYGTYGVLMIIGFYYAGKIFSKNRYLCVAAQSIVLIAMMSSQALQAGWPIQLYAIFAAVPIALYSGKKGQRLPRLFGYIYYPAHIAVLLLAKLLFF